MNGTSCHIDSFTQRDAAAAFVHIQMGPTSAEGLEMQRSQRNAGTVKLRTIESLNQAFDAGRSTATWPIESEDGSVFVEPVGAFKGQDYARAVLDGAYSASDDCLRKHKD